MTTNLLVQMNPLTGGERPSEKESEEDKLRERLETHLRKGHLLSSSGLFILFPRPVMTGATCSKGTKRAFFRSMG